MMSRAPRELSFPFGVCPDGVVAALGAAPPLQGFGPFSASRSSGSDSSRDNQIPSTLRLQGSSPLDAFFLPKPPSHVSDRNAHGILLFEGFPFRSMVQPFGFPCPPGVSSIGRASSSCRARSSPAFRALISAEVRCPLADKRQSRPVPPLSFRSPPGVHLHRRRFRSSRIPPPSDLGRRVGNKFPALTPVPRSIHRRRP